MVQVCAVYTEEAHRKQGIAGKLLNMEVDDMKVPKEHVTACCGIMEACINQNDNFMENMMEKELKRVYRFYGWEDADKVSPVTPGFENIRDLRDMYDLLTEIWSKETCAPRMQDEWTPQNMTLGQCSITAFLIQDIFGGGVYGIEREDGNYHCYNIIDGKAFDLTSEQFGEEVLDYENNPIQLRDIHFEKEEKHQRYLVLKEKLGKRLDKLSMLKLIDKAAKGDIDAAAKLAEAYCTGKYGDKNHIKAKKWADYAAKHGSGLAKEILSKL